MRILHLSSVYSPFAVGGAERVVQVLAEGMAATGIEVGVAHLAPTPRPSGRLQGVDVYPLAHRNPLWIENSARYPSPVRNINKVATLFNFLTAGDFATLLDTFTPDIVHSHSMVELTPWMWDVAKRRGIPIVHTLHDYDLLCIRGALFKDGQRCVQRHAACTLFSQVKKHYHRAIDQVVGVSRSILEIHLNHGLFTDLPETNRHVVWNPLPYTPAPDHASRANRNGPIVFGFLGRLVPEKGIHVLLEACRRLGGEDWRLEIGGRAPTGDSEMRARAAGLPIEFLGYVDPNAFFNRIDVFLAPTIWLEPFGLTVVEAFAAGVPVIGSELGGTAEIIRAVEPKWLLPPNDSEVLAAAMSKIIGAGRSQLGTSPQFETVLATTSPEFVIARYLDIYRACLTSKRIAASTTQSRASNRR